MSGPTDKKICGLVMPISAIDGMAEAHWAEVLAIISDAIDKAGFAANLVSNAEEVGIIQKRIIQNLYDNPIAVCDVSGKNPNVMFELGMRLAFDKPTIIVKDDKTSYSFDTAPIEHVTYPRDLRYAQIVEFKDKLAEKIKGTYNKASSDSNYTTFLKNFGEFTVAKLDKKEVSGQEYILEELKAMRISIERLARPSESLGTRVKSPPTRRHLFKFMPQSSKTERAIEEYLLENDAVEDYSMNKTEKHMELQIDIVGSVPREVDDLIIAKIGTLVSKERT